MSFQMQLGDHVRDIISGFQGIATARSEFLWGCTRVMVQPRETKDGQPIESHWFDEPQLQVITPAVITPAAASPEPRRGPGGPREDAKRGADAVR
ncbi:MAG TPA: hypothetical protein VMY35_06400 [Phycisphaerae bacterium]|nr:hypothetical protein [Phycisphaerae bacterium]